MSYSKRRWLLLLVLVMPGTAGFAFCIYYALLDWAQLQKAYAQFARVAAGNSDQRTLFIAEARQNIHRINVFADVVWALLCAVLAAIGIHGLCVMVPKQE